MKDWIVRSLRVSGPHIKWLDQAHHEESRFSLGDMTGTMSSVSTHALRILGGIVDCTRRSHCYSRGHRWSHGPHRVEHWRTKTCVSKSRWLVSTFFMHQFEVNLSYFYLEEVGWGLEVEANLCSWQQGRSWGPGWNSWHDPLHLKLEVEAELAKIRNKDSKKVFLASMFPSHADTEVTLM